MLNTSNQGQQQLSCRLWPPSYRCWWGGSSSGRNGGRGIPNAHQHPGLLIGNPRALSGQIWPVPTGMTLLPQDPGACEFLYQPNDYYS